MKQPNAPTPASPFCYVWVHFKENGRYHFLITEAEGGDQLLFSKEFDKEDECANAARRLLQSEPTDRRFETKQTKKGQYYFVLKLHGHKETGRSPMFDSPEELKKKLSILKKLDSNAPLSLPSEQRNPEILPVTPQPAPAVVPPPTPEPPPLISGEVASEHRPRYKFSLIYYPDSGVWTLKNDFSGATEQLKSCNGAQIERFLRAQLPLPETPAAEMPAQPIQTESTRPAKPAKSPEMLELYVVDNQGEPLGGAYLMRPQEVFSVYMESPTGTLEGSFDVKLAIKPMSGAADQVIGMMYSMSTQDGRLVIPMTNAPSMQPGTYMVTAQLSRTNQHPAGLDYFGSRLIVLH